MQVTQMIKICKEEFDRLMETSPTIPDKIIKNFKTEFKHMTNDKSLAKIIKPEICDSLTSTELSRNPWSSDENRHKKMVQLISKDKQNIDIIINFKQTFYEIHNRQALDVEIIDNLRDKIDISILEKLIEQIKIQEITLGSSQLVNNNSENMV